jgi:hypothetical protein
MRTVIAIALIFVIPVSATICHWYFRVKAKRTYRQVIDRLLE